MKEVPNDTESGKREIQSNLPEGETPEQTVVKESGGEKTPANRILQAQKVTGEPKKLVIDFPERDPIDDPVRYSDKEDVIELRDAKNRRYLVKRAVVDLGYLDYSHDAQSFSANPNYPKKLQNRDRSQITEQAKIKKQGTSLDTGVLTSENIGATEGAPVVYIKDGHPYVVQGNGRVMSISRAVSDDPSGLAKYEDIVRQKAANLGISTDNMEHPVYVRVMDKANDTDAIHIATDGQESTAGTMNRIEKSRAIGRSIGIEDGPPGVFSFVPDEILKEGGLTTETATKFMQDNPKIAEFVREASKSGSVATKEEVLDIIKGLFAHTLPENAKIFASNGTDLGNYIYESAPYFSYVHSLVKSGQLDGMYDLMPFIEDSSVLFNALSRKRMSAKQIVGLLKDLHNNINVFEDESYGGA